MNTNATTTNATITQKCTFCPLPAVPSDTTDPPACASHADLWILVEWMESKSEEVTAETVAAHVAKARATSKGWTITPGEVVALLPAVMEARNGVKV